MTRKEMKKQAKENIKMQLGTMILVPLIYVIIAVLINVFCQKVLKVDGLGSVFIMLLNGPLLAGLYFVFYKNSCNHTVSITDMFEPVKENAINTFFGGVLITIFTFLWTLLFIIPGIVKSYSYSMAYFLLGVEPDINGKESIDLSKDYMEGHKMDLFVLDLSFIGWYILSAIFLFIPLLIVMPYHYATRTLFFKQLYDVNGYIAADEEDYM